jgi:geranylgeranyl diphosphate synthase type II
MSKPIDHLNLFNLTFGNFISTAWQIRDSRLHQAIRYCLEGDGKRVRAMMAMLTCEAFGKDSRRALSAATSVEMIHAYSLAHDDLPCMDSDDWRRGKPSLHKAFDDATALLAGDAILTDAMRVLTDDEFYPESALIADSERLQLVRELSLAAGSQGMVFGQDLDMYWTGKGSCDETTLDLIHRGKTGALMGAACSMGAITGGATRDEILSLRRFGVCIGLAFQAIDDVLDLASVTGKSAGKDQAQGKLTYLTLFSEDEIRSKARTMTTEAQKNLPDRMQSDKLIPFIEQLIFRTR